MMRHADRPLTGRRILVVEDEAMIALGIQIELEESGAEDTILAVSLHEAEQIVGRDTFDAAVLDVRMPDGSTDALARSLIESATPVVFHSGHADERLHDEFEHVSFCEKPAMPGSLSTAVVHAIGSNRSRVADPRDA